MWDLKSTNIWSLSLFLFLSFCHSLSVCVSQSMEAQMQLYPGLIQLKSDISGQSDVDGADMLHRRPMGIEVQSSGGVAETRIVRLIEPLKERRRILLASKEMHQVTQDLEDEIVSLPLSPGRFFFALSIFTLSKMLHPCFFNALANATEHLLSD